MIALRVMYYHAVDVEHLHEQTEGGGVADADCVVVFKYAVGVVAVLLCVGYDEVGAGVVIEVCGHPIVHRKLLFIVAHVLVNDLVKDLRRHVERLLVLVAEV